MTRIHAQLTRFLSVAAVCLAAVLAGCSGGGGGQPADAGTGDAGSVMLVVDTAAGDDTLVQFQVAGAVLEDINGGSTANLLGQVAVVTFDDPSGEASGLQLRNVPGGNYAAVHLLLAPGSGYSLAADGTAAPVQGPLDLRIPIAGGLLHDALRASWLLVGHDAVPMVAGGGALQWNPEMSARGDAAAVALVGLTSPVVTSSGITVSAPALGSAPLFLEFDVDSEFEGEDGSPYADQDSFLADAVPDQQIQVDGDLCRDGRVRVGRVRHCHGNDEPRLIGRVQSVDGVHQTFELRVQAINQHGQHDILDEHEDVVVRAAAAVIRRPNGDALAFGALAEGMLAKVRWGARWTDDNGREVFVATDVEVPGNGSGGLHPLWRGRVDSVDLVASTFVIVPYGNHAIVIDGQQVAQATVVVDADTEFELDDDDHHGSGAGYGLGDLQVGVDRVWVRGVVDADGRIVADRVLVLEQHD